MRDDGLHFASVVALTVSLGLGLSATVHILNRMMRDLAASRRPEPAVERATILMGPTWILTTLVLSCALATTVLSHLPMPKLSGWLSALAMLCAPGADLFILRPTIARLYSFGLERGSGRADRRSTSAGFRRQLWMRLTSRQCSGSAAPPSAPWRRS